MTEMTPTTRGQVRQPLAEPRRQQVVEWAVCGIVAAGARFVPVPLLDDVIRRQATRIAVSRTLSAHGRTYPADDVSGLFERDEGRWAFVRRALAVPRKIILYPVRKYVAIMGSVTGVPTDVLSVVLLGRAVHRCLAAGMLTGEDGDLRALQAEAARVRRAFDDARSGTDWRIALSAISDSLVGLTRLGATAAALGHRLAGGHEDDIDREIEQDGEGVGTAARRLAEALRRPEVAEELRAFDARFDAALGI